MMQIDFLGAADCVTGSRHLVDWAGQRVLLDAGLFQGFKVLRERNWQAPTFEPRSLAAVVLSHAHLDHSGWLPVLVRHGYRGPIYTSPATRDLAEVVLLDAAHLQEEDARRANRHGFSQHERAKPLFTQADARRAVSQMEAVGHGKQRDLGHGLMLDLIPAGHLLGASCVRLQHDGQTLVFSGDLGRSADLLMPPMCCWSNRPTATACTSTKTASPAWPTSSATPSRGAVRCCCRRSRSGALKRCCG
jgi:metallo-beta-lactamase family protein